MTWEEDPMTRAILNGAVLAQTDHPVLLEGNVAFWNGVQVELAPQPQDQTSGAG
jgi:hypothetical protein